MWTSLCNFFCNKLFPRPNIALQQSNDIDGGIYRKRLKLIDRVWDSNDLLNTDPCSMQKENVEIIDDDQDCCIIAEIPRRKMPSNLVTVKNMLKWTSTAKNSQKDDFSSTDFNEVLPEKNSCISNIKEVKCIGNISKSNANTSAQAKKIFNTQRTYLSSAKATKSRLSFKHQLRRKMNFLQESYRLAEKHQYMQLLQSHTTYDLFNAKQPLKIRNNVNKQVEIIDLLDENSDNEEKKDKLDDQDIQIIKEVSGARSFQDIFKVTPLNVEIVIKEISNHYKKNTDVSQLSEKPVRLINDDDIVASKNTDALEEKLRDFMRITSSAVQKAENRDPYYLPKLTLEQEKRIKNSLLPEPSREVLSQCFGLQITRQDMQTLVGLNWLNDEIINFYMNLIMDRSKQNKALPRVYAFNTFFYPKLVSDGYKSLRRWTKQVDIFSFDKILVPIHLGMHWCLSVIDFRHKSVRHYDSVGSPNDSSIKRLLLYLEDESLDKRKETFPINDWEKLNVKDIPQQMNGGDCGVFSCMFAEHLARNCSILFTQDDMPYFRRKMVIEILEKKLLT